MGHGTPTMTHVWCTIHRHLKWCHDPWCAIPIDDARLMNMCLGDVTYTCVQHDSPVSVTCLRHATWLIDGASWLIHTCDMTHEYVQCVTHSHLRHDSFTPVTLLNSRGQLQLSGKVEGRLEGSDGATPRRNRDKVVWGCSYIVTGTLARTTSTNESWPRVWVNLTKPKTYQPTFSTLIHTRGVAPRVSKKILAVGVPRGGSPTASA